MLDEDKDDVDVVELLREMDAVDDDAMDEAGEAGLGDPDGLEGSVGI